MQDQQPNTDSDTINPNQTSLTEAFTEFKNNLTNPQKQILELLVKHAIYHKQGQHEAEVEVFEIAKTLNLHVEEASEFLEQQIPSLIGHSLSYKATRKNPNTNKIIQYTSDIPIFVAIESTGDTLRAMFNRDLAPIIETEKAKISS